MHYPWWYVPFLTSPMLIAAIAVVHVLVSHYAVGGGLFLAVETRLAYRTDDKEYLAYLRGHTGFFVLVTVVFGAITGVGIWWTIGLASPLSTEVLIRSFVFGWATEYVFFVLEIVSAFAFYYYWGRLAPKVHCVMGWIYGVSAWISLVLITGITAFMLHPGAWLQTHSFWAAFFNPQFLPQTVARTGGALLLSSLYVYLHASITVKDRRLHDLIARRSARPALLGAILVTVGGLGWYVFLPPSAKAALESAAVLSLLTALIFVLTVAVFVLLYLGPYRNPGWLSPGFAATLTLLGIAAFSTGEFIREAVRKPYVLYNVVLGSQIYPDEVEGLRETGFLGDSDRSRREAGSWTGSYKAEVAAQILNYAVNPAYRAQQPPPDVKELRRELGQVIFMYHCNDCHATTAGYSAVAPLVRGWTRPRIVDLIEHLDEGHFFMPPWAGIHEEAELLADYLELIAPERPQGMLPDRPAAKRPAE